MKAIRFSAVMFLCAAMLSCLKSEEFVRTKIHYQYSPETQPHQIELTVVPTENVELNLEDMDLEVNADYFNRYGIGVNTKIDHRISLPDDVLFGNTIYFPPIHSASPKRIAVYVLPREAVNVTGALGYAVLGRNAIVLREDAQTNRTLAHEIVHILGLHHLDHDNNVMRPYFISGQYDVPNDFLPQQIDTVLTNLNNDFENDINSLIVDRWTKKD
jgi:predicted Zn-dependent protease